MATGDQNDQFNRIKALFANWFGDNNTVRDALLQAPAYAKAWIFGLIGFAKQQARIMTATGGWLDIIASDFFGTAVQRKQNDSDASFLGRIRVNMFRERGTRNAITKVLTDLTGRAPVIFEPALPSDTGGLAVNLALGVNGALGSLMLPNQAFVTAYRPSSSGIPNTPGLGNAPFGLGISAPIVSLAQIQGAVADADIYAAVDAVKPAGTIVWTQISS